MIAKHLDRLALEGPSQDARAVVRHVIVQPGVVHTNISNALTGAFLDVIKIITFYLVRLA